MKVTTTLALAGALCAPVGCKTKEEPAPTATTAVHEPTPSGSAEPTPTGSAGAPVAGCGVGITAAGGPTYGACDVTARGAIDFESHTENQPSAVLTDYWITAETKAATDKLRAAAEARGEVYRVTEQPLVIVCQDAPRGLYIRFSPTLSKLGDIKQAPKDFPIARKPEDKSGVMRAEVKMREGGIAVAAGGLHVTRWEQGELAATFELDVETFDEPPKKAKLSGTLVYHCADNARCGTK
jgi:hypothetical protein